MANLVPLESFTQAAVKALRQVEAATHPVRTASSQEEWERANIESGEGKNHDIDEAHSQWHHSNASWGDGSSQTIFPRVQF